MEPGKRLLQIKKAISPEILRLPLLKSRRRLLFTGDLTTNDTGAFVTDSLVTAIKRYQHRNGLTEDGDSGDFIIQSDESADQRPYPSNSH